MDAYNGVSHAGLSGNQTVARGGVSHVQIYGTPRWYKQDFLPRCPLLSIYDEQSREGDTYPARGVASNESIRLLGFPEDRDSGLRVFSRDIGNHLHRINLSYVTIIATQLVVITTKLARPE